MESLSAHPTVGAATPRRSDTRRALAHLRSSSRPGPGQRPHHVPGPASGFAPTFPADTWFPPVITIDHELTRDAAAPSVRTIDLPGSDHRALLATNTVPLEAVVNG